MAPCSGPDQKSSNNRTDEVDDEANEEPIDTEDLAEIERVNSHLDSLNSALDAIEQRNDNIHAQLLELLMSNREIRESLQNGGEESAAVTAAVLERASKTDRPATERAPPAPISDLASVAEVDEALAAASIGSNKSLAPAEAKSVSSKPEETLSSASLGSKPAPAKTESLAPAEAKSVSSKPEETLSSASLGSKPAPAKTE